MSAVQEWLKWHSIRAHIVAPVWVRIPEKIRWRIVSSLNKSPRRCWSELVDGALARTEADACDVHIPVLIARGKPNCASTCYFMHPDHTGAHDCSCYCGKFQFLAAEGSLDRRQAGDPQ